MSVCECVCAGRAGTAASSSVEQRARESKRAEKAGRGARARRRSHPGPGRGSATMLNNLTDCEDGDGGANPGEQRSGGGEERRQLWG